jgi:peptidoglycan/LPS O-acetylase OafA/YrhL
MFITFIRAQNSFLKTIYIKPYCRLSSYINGILLGYIIERKSKKVNNNYRYIRNGVKIFQQTFGFILFALLMIIIMAVNRFSEVYFVKALVESSYRQFYSMIICYIIYNLSNCDNLLTKFLSSKYWRPLRVSSQTAYLIHPIIVLLIFDNFNGFDDCGIALNSIVALVLMIILYLISIVLTLVFELPLISMQENITNFIFSKKNYNSNVKID